MSGERETSRDSMKLPRTRRMCRFSGAAASVPGQVIQAIR